MLIFREKALVITFGIRFHFQELIRYRPRSCYISQTDRLIQLFQISLTSSLDDILHPEAPGE
jgi:hypothetical protein